MLILWTSVMAISFGFRIWLSKRGVGPVVGRWKIKQKWETILFMVA